MALLAQTREARGRLSTDQLDAVPPQALAAEYAGAENSTSVIPRALTVPRLLPVNEDEPEPVYHRTSRLESPRPRCPGAAAPPAVPGAARS